MLYLYESEKDRINDYKTYEMMALGDHFSAFKSKWGNSLIKDFKHMNYLAVNFAGMVSRLSADMLFEEPPQVRLDGNEDWLKGLYFENDLDTQLYESAFEGSYRGDIVFKTVVVDGKVVIQDINPSCFFPKYDTGNIRNEPTEIWLAWEVDVEGLPKDDKKCARVEVHKKGSYENRLYKVKEGVLGAKLPLKTYFPDLEETVNTEIDDFLVHFAKNTGNNSSFFGISDYKDLISLFHGINNRLSRIDAILNKHGDPILAVPEGVLDEAGQANRTKFGLIEVASGESAPQYIVWDAKLESTFKQIDYLVEFLFMTAEMSKSAFGIDKDGLPDSGKALKYKLIRTLAKKHRKELYYDTLIKKVLLTAQKLSKAHGATANGVAFKGEPKIPEVVWQDGVVYDAMEDLDVIAKELDLGLITKVDAIAKKDTITEAEAQDKVEEIKKEAKENMPDFSPLPKNVNPSNNIVNGDQ